VVEWAETTEPEAPELPIPHRVCVCRGFCFLLFVCVTVHIGSLKF
jgi:hypothetical protein